MEKQEAYEMWMEIQCRYVRMVQGAESDFARGMLSQEFISCTAELIMNMIKELDGELET